MWVVKKIYYWVDIKSILGLDVIIFDCINVADEVVKLDYVSWDNLYF